MGGYTVKVPRLVDLVAMKVFALKKGSPKRHDRDVSDIVHLACEHEWDLEAKLKPICDAFGSEAIYRELSTRVEEVRHA